MGYNVNPMLLVQANKNGQNPQQLMLNILQNNMSSSPMSANLYQLARSGNTAEIEKIVRNIAKSQGIDFFFKIFHLMGIGKMEIQPIGNDTRIFMQSAVTGECFSANLHRCIAV